MPIRIGEPITAEFLNSLERAAGVRDLTSGPGFSGPDFEAKSSRSGRTVHRWCKAVALISPHTTGTVSVRETGPGGDAAEVETEQLSAYALTEIEPELWCLTWTDADGTDYVSPMECPPE